MLNHANQIASLRELIKKGLYRQNLDALAHQCGVLQKGSGDILSFFVLEHVFHGISSALVGPVPCAAHPYAIAGIAEAANLILDKIESGQRIEAAELEPILHTHLQNMKAFAAAPSAD